LRSAFVSAARPDDLDLRPISRAEYDRLVAEGWFEGERIELLEGLLVEMSPEGPEHAWVIQQLNRILARGLPDQLQVRITHPWAAGDLSEPEPDIAVVPTGDYRRAHPARAVLLIEVSGSSRRKDLGSKATVYAAAGAERYWVVDLVERVVHDHREPSADGYHRVGRRSFDDPLEVVPGLTVSLAASVDDSPS
ncbi:MAG TPA: Uma2 family endonuclease, partial [Acidimicrobiia bacterium]